MPAGIGVDLGPVQPNRAQLQNPDLPCQNQHLHKQVLDLRQKSPPKHRYRIVIGMIVRGDEAERHRVICRSLQLAARKHPRRIAINQKPQQNLRMIRCGARPTIASAHRPEVKTRDHFHNETRQMPLRKPLIHRRRQQKAGITVYLAKIAHRITQTENQNRSPDSTQYPGNALSPTGC